MMIKKLNTHHLDVGCGEPAYRLDEVRALYPQILTFGKDRAWLAIYKDDSAIEYALFDFMSSDQKQEIYVGLVFHGLGFGAPLREMRHTFFGPRNGDGYVPYLDIDAVIWALTELKKYFD